MENWIPVSEACPDANFLAAELVRHGCSAKTAQHCVSMWIRTWKDSVSFNAVEVTYRTQGFPDWLDWHFFRMQMKLKEDSLAPPLQAAFKVELKWVRVTLRKILKVSNLSFIETSVSESGWSCDSKQVGQTAGLHHLPAPGVSKSAMFVSVSLKLRALLSRNTGPHTAV